MLLDSLPEPDRPPVWGRLGDLALFLSGVFPAAIERALTGRLDPARLARTTGLATPPAADLGPAELFEWLGAGWYRLAASHSSRVPMTSAPITPAPVQGAPATPVGMPAPVVTSTTGVSPTALRDNAEHFHQARRVLNATADRYLFPVGVDWLTPPG